MVKYNNGNKYSDTNELMVQLSGSAPADAATVNTPGDNRRTVTTAATAVPISATSLPVISAIITAETDNTGIIVVGASTVVAALATRRGTPLGPGDSMVVENVNLNALYIDSTVNGDGVTYTILS